MKDAAKTSDNSVHSIIADVLPYVSDSVKIALPRKSTIKRRLRRMRKVLKNNERIPDSIKDFIVPEELSVTKTNEQFLYYDSGSDDPLRILIFTTKSNLKALKTFKHWFADGTFDLCPMIFSQIYTIHAFHKGTVLPLVYAFLPSKTEQIYKKFLTALKGLRNGLNPDIITIDLELGFKNAFSDVFETARIHYCFFHFSQALYRKLGEHGLKALYDSDEQFSLKLKTLAALAFIPPANVVQVFEQIVLENFNDPHDQLDQYILYFQKTYIGTKAGLRDVKPRFEIHHWNQYSATINGHPRTNNSVEGWHRGFQYLFNKRNISIWDVIRAKKKYFDYNTRIQRIVKSYNQDMYQDNDMQYINDLAALLQL